MTDLETTRTPHEEPVIPVGAENGAHKLGAQNDVTGNELVLPLIGWVLVLVGWGLVGLIIAYIDRGTAPPYLRDSYRYLIRTFWIGCLFIVLLGLAVLAGFGLAGSDPGGMRGLGVLMFAGLAGILLALWHLARCIKAIVLLVREQPIRHPGTWLV